MLFFGYKANKSVQIEQGHNQALEVQQAIMKLLEEIIIRDQFKTLERQSVFRGFYIYRRNTRLLPFALYTCRI